MSEKLHSEICTINNINDYKNIKININNKLLNLQELEKYLLKSTYTRHAFFCYAELLLDDKPLFMPSILPTINLSLNLLEFNNYNPITIIISEFLNQDIAGIILEYIPILYNGIYCNYYHPDSIDNKSYFWFYST